MDRQKHYSLLLKLKIITRIRLKIENRTARRACIVSRNNVQHGTGTRRAENGTDAGVPETGSR